MCAKKLIKWVYQKYLLIISHRIILLPYIIFAYNISQNYPITIYNICLESDDQGLSNKTRYMM